MGRKACVVGVVVWCLHAFGCSSDPPGTMKAPDAAPTASPDVASNDGSAPVSDAASDMVADGVLGPGSGGAGGMPPTGAGGVGGAAGTGSGAGGTAGGGGSAVMPQLDASPPPAPDAAGLDTAPHDVSGEDAASAEAATPDRAPDNATAPSNSWTIFVYGHADHNLSASLFTDLLEMLEANLGSNVRVVLLADWDARQTIPDTTDRFPSGHFMYLLQGNQPTLMRVASGPELNLDDPAVVTASVSWAFRTYPATRYGVVLWDHGGGWKGGFGGDGQDGTVNPGEIAPETLAVALRQGVSAAGLTAERPLEFVAFDTCLMAGVEVIAPFASVAKTFIAAAELDYGDGWDYRAAFSWLGSNPNATAIEFGAQEVVTWDLHHAAAGPDDRLLRSHVALDLSQFPAFTETIRSYTTAVKAGQQSQFSGAALRTVPTYSTRIAEPTPSSLRDLGQSLRGSSMAPGPAMTAITALERLRVARSYGSFRAGQDGIHAEIVPAALIDPAEIASYKTRAATWDAASGWSGMLESVRAAADATAPAITGMAQVPPNATAANPPRVDFSLTDGDVQYVEGNLAQRHPTDPNLVVINGFLDAAFVTPGNYRLSWPGTQWAIPAQPQSLPITLSPWVLASTATGLAIPIFRVPGTIVHSWGETAPCSLLVTADTLTASVVAVDVNGRASVRPLSYYRSIDPMAAFVPAIDMIDVAAGAPVQGRTTSGVYLPADGTIRIDTLPAPAGEYFLLVSASDVWGNDGLNAFRIDLSGPIPQ